MNISIEDIEKKIQPWLNAQRIGIAVYGVMTVPQLLRLPAQYDSQKLTKLNELSDKIHLALNTSWQKHFNGEEDPQYQQDRLAQLPPSVLYLLDNILSTAPKRAPEDIQNMKPLIKEALSWLDKNGVRKKGAKIPSPLSKAQIIAYHILDGVSSARRVVALSASLGNDNNSRWQEPLEKMLEDREGLEQLEKLLRVVRSPYTDTESALSAISQL